MQNILKIDDQRFNRLALLGLGVAFILQLTVVATAFLTYTRNQMSSERVEHTHAVLEKLNETALAVERTETTARGYMLSGDQSRVAAFRENFDKLPRLLDELEALTADNPFERRQVPVVRAKVERQRAEIGQTMALAIVGRMDEAVADFRSDAPLKRVVVIRSEIAKVAAEEHRLLAERRSNEARSASLLKAVLGGAALLMTLASLATFLLARRYIGDLSSARDRLFVLNHDLEGEVERRTADLARANDEVQRFAYIVSHDLRSPLVNILGFTAELETTNATLGGLIAAAEKTAPDLITADVRDAQTDLPEAIGFIRSSTKKMDRLINAILRLSREGRRSLTPELLPMDHVLDEIVATLSQTIEAAGASVAVATPLPDLTNDRVAIEQIFSNLIENAIKYLQDGRAGEIKISGRVDGERAIFDVEDNGRGIAAKDHQRIFELFRRSGAQDRTGEGIGLAQVRALTNRLGGYIDVESELGTGSTFRLNLPVTFTDHGVGNE